MALAYLSHFICVQKEKRKTHFSCLLDHTVFQIRNAFSNYISYSNHQKETACQFNSLNVSVSIRRQT